MSHARHRPRRLLTSALATAIGLAALFLFGPAARANDILKYALSDLRVVYVFHDAESIDWPSLYYLNDRYGVRVDLVTIKPAVGYGSTVAAITDRQIFLHTYTCGTGTPLDSQLSRIMADLFADRDADVVLSGISKDDSLEAALLKRLQKLPVRPLFNVIKIYQVVDSAAARSNSNGAVVVNTREKAKQYAERMDREIVQLFPWFKADLSRTPTLQRYATIKRSTGSAVDADFVSGFEQIRLVNLLDSTLGQGAVAQSFKRRARTYVSLVRLAMGEIGGKRVQTMLGAYKELLTLRDQAAGDTRLSTIREFDIYLADLAHRLQTAILSDVGLTWDGKIVVHDSPEGPKLKFIASLAAAGPSEITLNNIRFVPYWDTLPVPLDSEKLSIAPHQNYVREYLVGVDPARLEAKRAESLLFAADIAYGTVPFTVYSSVPIWQTPDLSVSFQPNFFFVPPVAKLDVDRVVASMNWKAVIRKPAYYYGRVQLKLETPRGVFAGAYQTERELDKGRTNETVRIPFTVSNLFELGIQEQIISVSVDGKLAAADTGLIRIAACEIADTIKIGFLPDSTGTLEDILRMTGAGFQPITDRALLTADLDAYNVIVIGSGAQREYPSLRQMKGRFEEYLRDGGSIVLFGQPSGWPETALPVGCIPGEERLDGSQIANRTASSSLLAKPYPIAVSALLQGIEKKTDVAAAVVSPAEAVFVTPSGATLLSVTRLGDGQIIYCGLPLVEMISHLNIEAIHLFANLLNY